MGKKRSSEKKPGKSYNNNPFKNLKGFAVSAPEEDSLLPEIPENLPRDEKERTFVEEMNFLGVAPLGKEGTSPVNDLPELSDSSDNSPQARTDEELFLGSLGQLEVRFIDQVPEQVKVASPRRLKQLKLGRLIPQASLDLHGLQRHQVAEKIGHFLQNAVYQQWQTLLIVTGRGLHSAEGEPVLRDEAEKILEEHRKTLIAEWGRAPRQYGGEGALVIFMKNNTAENE